MAKLFYDRYIKLAHIGRGANAHVYKVKHAELGYVRAIKILNDYIENKDEKLYKSFLNECRTLLTIGNGCHPNIVRIYAPDLIDNHAVVEMDYVQGTTLDSYIKERKFIDYAEVMRFIHDIVGALAYTHHDIYQFLMSPDEDNIKEDPNDGSKYLIDNAKEKELVKKYGIAHNDLHSNNIMRREYDGSFMLLDFGLAVQDGRCVKSSHMADGNPEYVAPEKFDSETVNPRSDVYSLGILMYEIIAGRVPFELEYSSNGTVTLQSKNKLQKQHQSATPPDILPFRKAAFEEVVPGAEYERDYPEWLDKIIMKCLAKNPEDRYSDAKEILDDVNRQLESSTSDKELVTLKETVEQLSEECSSERSAKESLLAELDKVNDKCSHLQEKVDVVTIENKELHRCIGRLKGNTPDSKIIEENSLLKSENDLLQRKWKYEKSEKERLQSLQNDKIEIEEREEVLRLKENIERLSEQWTYEKAEKEKLLSKINEIDKTHSSKSSKKWLYGFLISIAALIGVSIWGYCMYLNYETSDFILNSFRNEASELGLYTDTTGFLKNPVVTRKEMDTITRKEADTITDTKTIIEYRTPPDVQKELKQLRERNNELQLQVGRYRKMVLE